MLHFKSLLAAFCALPCLLAFVLAGPISASLVSAGSDLPEAESDRQTSHALLLQQLCELNANWKGRSPDLGVLNRTIALDDEVALIQTHLKLVIHELETADVAHLSGPQVARRKSHVEVLKAYMEEGRFPQNVFVAGRRPVFIDPWGTHCAVGHLIAVSGHPELARTINHEHRLDFLRDIKTDGLAEWQHASGLSPDELALIQPTYVSTTLKYPAEIESLTLGNSEQVIAAIETGELDVDARCGGKTLLHFAATAGDLALVKLLAAKGADLHAVSQLGCDRAAIAKGGRNKVVTVRWNEPTVATGGRLSIGIRGAVFGTLRGDYVAHLLSDHRGGRAGLNALDYATDGKHHSGYRTMRVSRQIPYRKGLAWGPEDEGIAKLKQGRAAVAAWLTEQGVTRFAKPSPTKKGVGSPGIPGRVISDPRNLNYPHNRYGLNR